MSRPLATEFGSTPSQTAGPYLALTLPWVDGPDIVPDGTPGAIRIVGRLTDGEGAPIPDGLIETWQADQNGRFAHPDDPRGPVAPGFRGFGRCPTDAAGRFWFRTVKPAGLPTETDAAEAPNLDVSVFARGLLHRLVTRVYFPDEAEANAADPVLASLDESDRALLVARPESDGTVPSNTLRFDIRLQGEGETPFFRM